MTDVSTKPRVIASGLLGSGEGPVALADGSFLVVEGRRGTLTHVSPAGTLSVVATVGGGPNGVALGPDGAAYVTNHGGWDYERWSTAQDMDPDHDPAPWVRDDYEGGWVDRVDLESGEVTRLITHVGDYRLRGPNQIVFDDTGGFWFTDLGKRRAWEIDTGGLFYATADGSRVETGIGFSLAPNGIGLSPDGLRLYVTESYTGRVVAFDVVEPGKISRPRTILVSTPYHLDSLAIEENGNIVVAVYHHGLGVVAPSGGSLELVVELSRVGNLSGITNICFGGPDMTTAYVTGSGQLLELPWPRPGLRLNYQTV